MVACLGQELCRPLLGKVERMKKATTSGRREACWSMPPSTSPELFPNSWASSCREQRNPSRVSLHLGHGHLRTTSHGEAPSAEP